MEEMQSTSTNVETNVESNDGKAPDVHVTSANEASKQMDEEAEKDGHPTEKDEEAEENERERLRREREARAQALTLEIVGDLPFAEVKPPENVLFVCKLNPVTEGQHPLSSERCRSRAKIPSAIDEDLHTIFSRFGPIVSCEVIRDKRTGDSLQYAFIEYENQKDCEQAYFKMPGVLIDDHRIHVDFSQSVGGYVDLKRLPLTIRQVSRVADVWRNKANAKRKKHGGGFGGVAELEKKRQYRKMEAKPDTHEKGYGMVFDKNETPKQGDRKDLAVTKGHSSRSRSPRERRSYRDDRDDRRRRSWSKDNRRADYDDKQRHRAGRDSRDHGYERRRDDDRRRDPRDDYDDWRRRR